MSAQIPHQASGKLLIVAGEASGDQIAAACLKELLRIRPELNIIAVGGPALEAAGATIIHSSSELAAMGLGDVLGALPRILRVRRSLRRLLASGEVRQLVLVDYPGFNLPLAEFAHELGLRVMYYISPKYWAWKSGRLKRVARATDRQALIFPFEEPDYKRVGGKAEFVGHPVFDLVATAPSREDARRELGLDGEEPLLLMLPGSRRGELKRHLPLLADTLRMLEEDGVRVVLQFPAHLDLNDWQEALLPFKRTRVIQGHYHQLIAAADLGLVASGTASLEAAALGLPHMVYYRLDGLASLIVRRVVKVKYASPVNLAANEELVPERLNRDANGLVLSNWVLERIRKGNLGQQGEVLAGRVRQLLAGPGASHRAAEMIAEEWDQATGSAQ
jgi:lipid-A-disaccharide synthase